MKKLLEKALCVVGVGSIGRHMDEFVVMAAYDAVYGDAATSGRLHWQVHRLIGRRSGPLRRTPQVNRGLVHVVQLLAVLYSSNLSHKVPLLLFDLVGSVDLVYIV